MKQQTFYGIVNDEIGLRQYHGTINDIMGMKCGVARLFIDEHGDIQILSCYHVIELTTGFEIINDSIRNRAIALAVNMSQRAKNIIYELIHGTHSDSVKQNLYNKYADKLQKLHGEYLQ